MQAIDSLSGAQAPRVLICGAKKTGKSTLARQLCNALLQNHDAVSLLETDCGQPQFGPQGFVSLTTVREPILLPPQCATRQPDQMILIGDASPQNNPITFISAVSKLYAVHIEGLGRGQRPPLA
jgi:polynucleotide 5'-hydroxyl-kinase GRC3/NOL9